MSRRLLSMIIIPTPPPSQAGNQSQSLEYVPYSPAYDPHAPSPPPPPSPVNIMPLVTIEDPNEEAEFQEFKQKFEEFLSRDDFDEERELRSSSQEENTSQEVHVLSQYSLKDELRVQDKFIILAKCDIPEGRIESSR